MGQEPDQYKDTAYHEALDLYKNQEWSKAIEAFKASDELEEMFGGRKTNPVESISQDGALSRKSTW